MRALVLSLLIALVGVPAAAHAGPQDRREAIKKKIRAMRAAAIVEQLSLDDQLSAKLIATLDRYDDETEKLVEKRVEITKRLRDTSDAKDTKAADHAVDDAVALQKSFRDLEDRRLGDVRKILSPQQTAKLLIVLPEFERQIQNRLRQAIQNANNKGNKKKQPAAESDDLDDDDARPAKKPRP